MRKVALILALVTLLQGPIRAEEGMWIPMLLEQLNVKRMQDLGMKLTAEDIYSVNHSSLKDAIVQFGNGCTAEIVSGQGLIFTNHHCGLGAIQKLSSLEHDYITDGFWAKSTEEELPCPGTSVTLLIRMEEVTAQVLEGVTAGMNQMQRAAMVSDNISRLEKEAVKGTNYEARIRPFFYGNQYYMFINQVFRDIRLVGAPPSSIGKFGGDTDNWMWPRHTGDFSVFRIYANASNEAAPYSSDNRPYQPKKVLPVSLKGYEKGDFTFVFGYPGTTREYLPSMGVDQIVNVENPLRIRLREKRLDIIKMAMDQSRETRIQYSAKAAGIANYWKKMIGESRGIQRIDGIEVKQKRESAFLSWVHADPARAARYENLLGSFVMTYQDYIPVSRSSIFITEGALGIEVVRFTAGFREIVKLSKEKKPDMEALSAAIKKQKKGAVDFYQNWQPDVDRKIMAVMVQELASNMPEFHQPAFLSKLAADPSTDYTRYAGEIFARSLFTDTNRLFPFLDSYSAGQVKKLESDPVYQFMASIFDVYEKVLLPASAGYNARLDSLQRLYMAAMMEKDRERLFYPDANGTLRVAFGKVDDYQPREAVNYRHFTTLTGVMQKEDPDIYDYVVDPTLKQLYLTGDYGEYADRDGTMHVAFIASNHTTGGNSGSPVLNANGEMIGINFDRNWEGTLSDLMYDPDQCRNIAIDIRYCLFVIDKVYGNQRLIRELQIVR